MRFSDLAAQTPMRHITIADGQLGTDQTVDQMKKLILSSLNTSLVRVAAEEIIGETEPMDKWGEVEAIYAFTRDKVRYTRDPKGLEYVQTPQHLLTMIEKRGQAFGDCDDKTTLGLSLLKSLGYDVAIRVAAYREGGPFTHVYGLVKIIHQWVPFDATPTDRELGWENPFTRQKDYQITPYGWDLGEIRMGDIDVSQIIQLAVAITLGGYLTARLMKR